MKKCCDTISAFLSKADKLMWSDNEYVEVRDDRVDGD